MKTRHYNIHTGIVCVFPIYLSNGTKMFSWIPHMRIRYFDFRHKVRCLGCLHFILLNSYKGISNMDIKWNWIEYDDMFQNIENEWQIYHSKWRAVPFVIFQEPRNFMWNALWIYVELVRPLNTHSCVSIRIKRI